MVLLLLGIALGLAEPPLPPSKDLIDGLALAFRQDGVVDTEAADKLLDRACQQGYTRVCQRDAWLGGDGLPDIQRAAPLFRPYCPNDPIACMVTGWADTQVIPGKPGEGAAQPDIGLRGLNTACDHGIQRACADVATLHNKGIGTAEDPAAALPLYRKACEAEQWQACRWLGTLYQLGRGVERDPAKAVSFYQRACEGGYVGGCNNLGLAAELGTGGEADRAAAAAFYLEACARGHGKACVNVTRIFANGPLPADADPTLTERGCQSVAPWACFYLGEQQVKANPTAARARYTQACERGVAPGCARLGALELDGLGGPTDPAHAATRLEVACAAGIDAACVLLGRQYRDGQGVTANVERAVQLFEQACAGGIAKGCSLLAAQVHAGEGVSKDKKRAKALLSKACELGDSEVCR